MNLNHANLKPQNLFQFCFKVSTMPWMNAATGNQPHRIFFHIVCNELVDSRSKSNHFGGHIVDEDSPIDPGVVQILQKGFRRSAEFRDLIEVRALLFHQLQSGSPKHFQWLNVNVAVSNQNVCRADASYRGARTNITASKDVRIIVETVIARKSARKPVNNATLDVTN